MPSGWILAPQLDVTHLWEDQASFTDSSGAIIGQEDHRLTEVTAGLGFEVPVSSTLHEITLSGGVFGTAIDETAGLTSDNSAHAGLEFGTDIRFNNGGNLSFGLNYDGIGDSAYESWGAHLGYNLQF